MQDEDAVNREVLARMGLDRRAFENADAKDMFAWRSFREALRPYRLDWDDLVAVGCYTVLTQHTKLSRAQASNVTATLRNGFRREPAARIWYVFFDEANKRFGVTTSKPTQAVGVITLDVGKLRARMTRLRSEVEEARADANG